MIFLYTAPLILIVLLYLRRRTLFYATTTRRSIFLFLFSLNLFSFGFGACRISKYASNIRQTGRIKHFLASAGEGGVFPEVHSLDISFFASLIGIVALSLLICCFLIRKNSLIYDWICALCSFCLMGLLFVVADKGIDHIYQKRLDAEIAEFQLLIDNKIQNGIPQLQLRDKLQSELPRFTLSFRTPEPGIIRLKELREEMKLWKPPLQ